MECRRKSFKYYFFRFTKGVEIPEVMKTEIFINGYGDYFYNTDVGLKEVDDGQYVVYNDYVDSVCAYSRDEFLKNFEIVEDDK